MTKKMPDFLIFCDSSFDPKSKRGVGGMLLLSCNELSSQIAIEDLRVRTRVFTAATSTRLEILTVLWAFSLFKKKFPAGRANNPHGSDITIISDCKTISDLRSRRDRLQEAGFKSKKSGKRLSNADLYKKYFLFYDEIKPEIIWLKGHASSRYHDVIQSLFSHVDKTTRARLRGIKKSVV